MPVSNCSGDSREDRPCNGTSCSRTSVVQRMFDFLLSLCHLCLSLKIIFMLSTRISYIHELFDIHLNVYTVPRSNSVFSLYSNIIILVLILSNS